MNTVFGNWKTCIGGYFFNSKPCIYEGNTYITYTNPFLYYLVENNIDY